MFTSEMLRLFPRRRIKAIDGMAVTAAVWEESHEYHRQLGRFHTLLLHGSGIITGLEVIASDPADSSIYVLPGIAVDPIGQTIVLPEPRAYDLGNAEGALYLILTFNESRPQVTGGRADEDAPRFVHDQFLLEAVTELPQTPYVELARVRRQGRDRPVQNAPVRNHPQMAEIDLRFRRHIGIQEQSQVIIGVVDLPRNGAGDQRHAEGLENTASAIQRAGAYQVWVEPQVRLTAKLEGYDLLYLVGKEEFSLSSDEMNALYGYLQAGGTIFYESCRRNVEQSGDAPADQAFRDLLGSLAIELKAVDASHALLRRPHLFGQAPDGFETRGAPGLEAGGGVIFSSFDYGCMWAGARRGRVATRSEIRNAAEWGENLIAYAIDRRRAAHARTGQTLAGQNGTHANGAAYDGESSYAAAVEDER